MANPVITLSLPQLALAFVPVAITLVILFRWSFGTGNALYALGRMLVQLLLIGYVLAWIFGSHSGWLIMLVLTIMLLASTRPILQLAEKIMLKIATFLGGTLTALWFTILTIGPILGSFITEPAAMTISAMLLSNQFYDLKPSATFKYATVGLLFVNVSVGGTITHFAAPPVLMVAGPWDWGTGYMMVNFGWKALLGILVANSLYYLFFRSELERMQEPYSLRVIKNDIRRTFIKRKYLWEEVEAAGMEIDNETGFRRNIEERMQNMITRIKEKLRGQYLADAERRGLDKDLVGEAFEQRFKEIKVNRLSDKYSAISLSGSSPRLLKNQRDEGGKHEQNGSTHVGKAENH